MFHILKEIWSFIKDNAIAMIALCIVITTILYIFTSIFILLKKRKSNLDLPVKKLLEEENHVMFQSEDKSEMTSDNDDETNEIPF